MNDKKILEKSSGVFGQISVGKSFFPETYWMKINDEIEGRAFADHHGKPGAIAASRYLYAFIIPVWHFPTSHGLMLGLGAGIGAAMLLTLFPALSLTVVEIDSEIIRLARAYFPLISLYEKQKRLTIIQANANDYIHATQNTFSFVLLDIFSGDESSQYNLALLEDVQALAPYFMANMITTEAMRPNVSDDLLWIRTSPNPATQRSNWMLTNMQRFSPDIGSFELFSQNQDENHTVKIVNHYFQYILSQIKATCFYD